MGTGNPEAVQASSGRELVELEREKDALRTEIARLREQEKALHQSIKALEIDKKVKGMTDEELNNELKKHQRD